MKNKDNNFQYRVDSTISLQILSPHTSKTQITAFTIHTTTCNQEQPNENNCGNASINKFSWLITRNTESYGK